MVDISPSGGGGEYAGEGGKQMRLPKQNINNEWFVGTIEVIKKMDFVLSTLTRVDDPRPKIMAREPILPQPQIM